MPHRYSVGPASAFPWAKDTVILRMTFQSPILPPLTKADK